MRIHSDFWAGKQVFVTGHTGFKGSWLCLWLAAMGAKVTGYALEPEGAASMFSRCGVGQRMDSRIGDVLELERLAQAVQACDPDVVIHMAAQPLVRASYDEPVGTYAVNVMGTVHLLEAVRRLSVRAPKRRSLVLVTTDKCYENHEWPYGYRETDRLGGHDPYSNSKACSELAASAYRSSFFPPEAYSFHGTALATARAGNVIGGGDWAKERLVPDCIRSFRRGTAVELRSPQAIRPWQHVLEPLSGYLLLAQRLYEEGPLKGEAWNFGPRAEDAVPVERLVAELCRLWGPGASYRVKVMPSQGGTLAHEAYCLKLDCSKTTARLGWSPVWDLRQAMEHTVAWYLVDAERQGELLELTLRQIERYQNNLQGGGRHGCV